MSQKAATCFKIVMLIEDPENEENKPVLVEYTTRIYRHRSTYKTELHIYKSVAKELTGWEKMPSRLRIYILLIDKLDRC